MRKADEDGDDAVARPSLDTLPRDALRSREFWLLTVAYLLASITTFAVAVHLVPYLHGRGFGTGAAATALRAVGLVQVLGRSTFVRLSAHRPSLHLATWVLAAKAIGLFLLLVTPGVAGVAAFVLVYGAANGVATLTRATTIAELYGAEHYGAISAVIAAVSAVGGALAPFGAAAAIELAGAEEPVFFALVALSVLAAAGNELVARPTHVSR